MTGQWKWSTGQFVVAACLEMLTTAGHIRHGMSVGEANDQLHGGSILPRKGQRDVWEVDVEWSPGPLWHLPRRGTIQFAPGALNEAVRAALQRVKRGDDRIEVPGGTVVTLFPA